MRNADFLTLILLMPIAGLAYYARSLWTSILALLASLGLSTCRADGNPTPATEGSQTDPKDAPPEVLCYRQPAATPVFQNERWESSPEMKEWAKAEKSVRLYANDGQRKEFDPLGKRIDSAEAAYASAKAAVDAGLLSAGAYEMAGRILSAWHRDLALNYTYIKCYEEAVSLPVVEDINGRLLALEKAEIAGDLSADAMAQAEAGIRKSLQGSLKPTEAKELASLLMDLLDF